MATLKNKLNSNSKFEFLKIIILNQGKFKKYFMSYKSQKIKKIYLYISKV